MSEGTPKGRERLGEGRTERVREELQSLLKVRESGGEGDGRDRKG